MSICPYIYTRNTYKYIDDTCCFVSAHFMFQLWLNAMNFSRSQSITLEDARFFHRLHTFWSIPGWLPSGILLSPQKWFYFFVSLNACKMAVIDFIFLNDKLTKNNTTLKHMTNIKTRVDRRRSRALLVVEEEDNAVRLFF